MNQNFYKDAKGGVYVYSDAEVKHGLVKSGLTQITEEEADAITGASEAPGLEQVYALRAAAYADPQTGSDRHFLEAARKRAEDDTAGADAATAAGLVRVTEIKAEYPLP